MAESGDKIGFSDIRKWAMSRAHGTGVEIGCGDGRNFEHLAEGVSLVGIEPEPQLAALARLRAAGKPIQIVQGIAENTGLKDESADFVVSTLTLCSVASLGQTLAETWRLLKPGGSFISVEHCLAPKGAFSTWQHVADLAWPHLFGGCHTAREIVPAIDAAGFQRLELEWFSFPSDRSVSPASWMFKAQFLKP